MNKAFGKGRLCLKYGLKDLESHAQKFFDRIKGDKGICFGCEVSVEELIRYTLKMIREPNFTLILALPEARMHVSHSRDFVDALEKVIGENSNLIIYTNSPDIIGNRWDMMRSVGDNETYYERIWSMLGIENKNKGDK